MDGVAAEAKASKATPYRRWSTKADLVIDALLNAKGAPNMPVPDTGSLRATWSRWPVERPASPRRGRRRS